MTTPTLTLTFIPKAYTDAEGKRQAVATFVLEAVHGSPGHWAMAGWQKVAFPTGDIISVMSEVTKYGNYFHANHQDRRLCSLKTTGNVDVMFLLPSGEEAYASLVGDTATV